MKDARIRGFDGIRALSMMLVFLTHRTNYVHELNIGSPAMWMFFIMSGYLIIGLLHKDRRNIEAGTDTLRNALTGFIGRRVRRIFPVYYLTLLTIVPLLVAYDVVKLDGRGAVMLFTYMTNIWIGTELLRWPQFLGHFWSLAIEEQFYLAIPFIALLTPSRYLGAVCLGIMALGVAVRIGMTLEGLPNITIHTNSLVNFALIAFGGWLRLSMAGDDSGKREGTRSWPAITILLVFFGLNYIGNRIHAAPILMHASTVLGGWALLTVAVNQNSWFVRMLEISPLLWFGRITYGFYIYHNLVGVNTLVPLLQAWGFDVVFPEHGAAVMSFAMALVTAWASYRWIEAPIIKGGRRRPAPADASSKPAAPNGLSPVADHDQPGQTKLAPGNKIA